MEFTVKPRRSLIVYLHSMKQVRQLKRFGNIQYQSRRGHYVVIYLDESQVQPVTVRLRKLNFVRRVEPSYRPDVDMNFGERVDQGFFKPQTGVAPEDDDD
ncbi:DUF2129 domain-containing protein [Lactobacillus sp. CBA3605]|uniref:YlbG family protein n=1 Tax=Lactobacillus sp. CBA3605 TaxID=2099788 RepID=UPI000CFCC0EE|nr:YlbG family protein [Lactobacillus sp. CBA3605]AVK60609.1 DUF2129 domain-containing protein [Lactobacillus sp. CBA3605]